MHVYQEKRSENKEISYSRTGITPAQPHNTVKYSDSEDQVDRLVART